MTLFVAPAWREAMAGKKEVLELHVDGNGAPLADDTKACVRRDAGTRDGNDDELTFEVKGGTLKADLHVAIDQVQRDWSAGKSTPAPPLPPGIYSNVDIVIIKKSNSQKICIAKGAPPPGGQSAAESKAIESGTLSTSPLNQQAMAAMEGPLHIAGPVEPAGTDYFGRTYTLYHLPDGTPAFPIPSHISEKDDIRLAVVLPVGATAKVDILACDQVPAVRVEGSLKAATEAAGRLQTLEAPTFVVRSYPLTLACAGTLTYRIQTSGGGASGNTTTSIVIDPVYRFHWGAGAMFDFGTPHVIALQSRPASSGMGSEKFITDTADRTGLKPILTLSASICKTNPKDFNACDVFVPTVWADPTRLTSGFGWGVGIRPGNYVAFIIGMTVFQTEQLVPGVNAPAGSTWTAAGDPPTTKVYTKESIGLALALSLDTDIFVKVFPKN